MVVPNGACQHKSPIIRRQARAHPFHAKLPPGFIRISAGEVSALWGTALPSPVRSCRQRSQEKASLSSQALLPRGTLGFMQRYETAERDLWGRFTSDPSLAGTPEVSTPIGEGTVFNSHLLISGRMEGMESGGKVLPNSI